MSLAINAKSAKARATIAANMIKKQNKFYRAFDDCFEMNDGHQVMEYLIQKTAKDPILAANINLKMPSFGCCCGDFNIRLHQAINQALTGLQDEYTLFD